MKIGTNMIIFGILSLLVGTAFASPLLISELDVLPFHDPLPKGPTADVSVDVVYTNFSVGDTSLLYTVNVTDISYFVVLNVTNNSNDWVTVSKVSFDAAEKFTKGNATSFIWSDMNSVFCDDNIAITAYWNAKGAWVDGEWYNLTKASYQYCFNDTTSTEYYWMEGVQLSDTYVNGELTVTSMNMNGTWVDVTGRIDVPTRQPLFTDDALTVSGVFFSEMKYLGQANIGPPRGIIVTDDGELFETNEPIHVSITTNVTDGFSNLWAPHESRLIAMSTSHRVMSEFVEQSRLELLEAGPIIFRTSVSHQINGTTGICDSTAVSEEIKPVQLELTEDGYTYNTILSDEQMFVMDSFGAEVFIEPRN